MSILEGNLPYSEADLLKKVTKMMCRGFGIYTTAEQQSPGDMLLNIFPPHLPHLEHPHLQLLKPQTLESFLVSFSHNSHPSQEVMLSLCANIPFLTSALCHHCEPHLCLSCYSRFPAALRRLLQTFLNTAVILLKPELGRVTVFAQNCSGFHPKNHVGIQQ